MPWSGAETPELEMPCEVCGKPAGPEGLTESTVTYGSLRGHWSHHPACEASLCYLVERENYRNHGYTLQAEPPWKDFEPVLKPRISPEADTSANDLATL